MFIILSNTASIPNSTMGRSRKHRNRARSPVEKPYVDQDQISYLKYLGGEEVPEHLQAPANQPDSEIRVDQYAFAVHRDKLVSKSTYFKVLSKWQFQV
jgi:hypothetical protein